MRPSGSRMQGAPPRSPANRAMTDSNTPDPTSDPVAQTTTEPTSDPVARLEGAAAKVEKVLNSINDLNLDDEQRADVDRYVSTAVSQALDTQRKKGELQSKDEVDAKIAAAMEARDRKDNLRDEMYGHLAEHGISPGSPRYHEFAKASADFKETALTTKEGIAKIVATMPSSQEAAKQQYQPESGQSLYGEKRVVIEGVTPEPKTPQLDGGSLEARIAAHERASHGR